MAVIPASHIRSAVDKLDENDGRHGLVGHASMCLRIGKISEELGEVWQALIGAVGQNPRKGYYSNDRRVVEELADVALTAIVAMATICPDDWERILEDTVVLKTDRLRDDKG